MASKAVSSIDLEKLPFTELKKLQGEILVEVKRRLREKALTYVGREKEVFNVYWHQDQVGYWATLIAVDTENGLLEFRFWLDEDDPTQPNYLLSPDCVLGLISQEQVSIWRKEHPIGSAALKNVLTKDKRTRSKK